MGWVGKIAKVSGIALLVVCGAVLLAMGPPKSNWKALSVQTGSMQPTIKTGSLVLVKRVPAPQIQVGDVITYISANQKQTITHRVVQIEGAADGPRQFITKGDANPSADKPVSQNKVVGRQEVAVPYVGHLMDFLHTWAGAIILVYLPALWIVAGELRRLTKYFKSLQPYMTPEFLARRKLPTGHHFARNTLIASLVLVLSLSVAVPVRAALTSSARLTGNSISGVVASAGPGSVTLRRVFVTCVLDTPGTATNLSIIFYNATNQTVEMSGWQLRTGATILFTYPAGTSIAGRSLLDSEVAIAPGLTYATGELSLHNAAGQVIDDLSWSHAAIDRTCRVTR